MEQIRGLKELTGELTELPRGGYLVDTSAGYIQFGSPPETLKDTIFLPKGVPSIFVLTMQHFDPKVGMSVAEIEFPIYYNYFLKKRKTKVYLSPEHIENMKIVLEEAVFGPKNLKIERDVDLNYYGYIPDLKREMDFFRAGRKLEDMVDIFPIDKNGFQIENVFVKPEEDGSFEVYENGTKITTVPAKINFKALYDLGKTISEPFVPAEFGITCLGNSHGFDPYQNTSGFILWINKGGIMVDPPANSTYWLRDSNINPKLIDGIILTHCHADHDAGTFQKILEETRVKIYSTPTVMESFVKKYSALTRIPASTIMKMFYFCPVKLGPSYNIHGAVFKFYYSLHSIPTISFRFTYRNKSFIYSSDHLNEPNIIKKFYEDGILSKERYEELLNFPWHFDIIYHEAGIPPLHTPVSYLTSLPENIQKKITVYHIAEKDFPANTRLKLAKFGVGETVYPEIERYENEEAYRILDVFSRIDVFKDLPFDRIKDLLLVVKKENFKKGDLIIKKDTPGDKFYVIISGAVSIKGLEEKINEEKIYTTFEYFGEASILFNTTRKADVYAETNVEAYVIEKDSFLRLIEGTKVEENIKKLAATRSAKSWMTIKSNSLLRSLTSFQITALESIMEEVEIKKNENPFPGEGMPEYLYIISEGRIKRFDENNKEEKVYDKGDIVGDEFFIRDNTDFKYKYIADTKVKAYRIKGKEFSKFLQENPGIWMNLLFERNHF
ncbi:MAG: cyclic nucleotide-binding domain-containing protein [Brevinematia bacterium]